MNDNFVALGAICAITLLGASGGGEARNLAITGIAGLAPGALGALQRRRQSPSLALLPTPEPSPPEVQ